MWTEAPVAPHALSFPPCSRHHYWFQRASNFLRHHRRCHVRTLFPPNFHPSTLGCDLAVDERLVVVQGFHSRAASTWCTSGVCKAGDNPRDGYVRGAWK
jgi:hypothetical protein